ncbi:hypothetical protein OEZ86_010594 [Tetradesmus obliquus]|nr:hypothetical protein OEZ86_010594 [Tetradesmus obliquus]
MGRKAHPLAARIKKMMQTDEDVGKIAQATPVMIARAMELFLQRLCNNAADVAAGRKAKTLTTSHLKAYVSSDELMDFLQDTVSKAPDLPAQGESEQPKPKRQRTESKREARTSAEGKRASADGAAAAAGAAAPPAAQLAEADEPAAAQVKQEQVKQEQVKQEQPKQEHAKQEETGSPSAQAAHAKLGHGFGGLGAHPFLAARSFGKAGAGGFKRRAGSSSSPKPASPAPRQQPDKVAPPAAEGSPQAEDAAAADAVGAQQPQPTEQQAAAGAAAGLPGLPGMLSVQALAGFQQQDDFDEDYDS